MRRKFRVVKDNRMDAVRIADASGRIVCTLPHDEKRLARFIVRCVNWIGFGLRTYDKHDWWMERNSRAKTSTP